MNTPPGQRQAHPNETGKSCPYCRFPLKERADVVECGSCGAVHHADCWIDNGGCAVMGCAEAPSSPNTGEIPPQPSGKPVAAASGPLPQATTGAQTESQSTNALLYVAGGIVVLALAIIAVASVVTITRDSGTSSAELTASSPSDSSDSSQQDSQPEKLPDTGALPDQSRSEMKSELTARLREFHENVVSGDLRGAWMMMSKRKQRQSRNETGYDGWKTNQESLQPYLDPSGLRITVIGLDRESGVATVSAKGMTWSQPGANCTEWSGVTWLKYEGGEWRYDPGYSTTRERERKWKSRFDELLGGQC